MADTVKLPTSLKLRRTGRRTRQGYSGYVERQVAGVWNCLIAGLPRPRCGLAKTIREIVSTSTKTLRMTGIHE